MTVASPTKLRPDAGVTVAGLEGLTFARIRVAANDRTPGPITTGLAPSTEPAKTTEIAAMVTERTNTVLIDARHSSCPRTLGGLVGIQLTKRTRASQDVAPRPNSDLTQFVRAGVSSSCGSRANNFDRFADARIGPAMAAAGLSAAPDIREFPVHEHYSRSQAPGQSRAHTGRSFEPAHCSFLDWIDVAMRTVTTANATFGGGPRGLSSALRRGTFSFPDRRTLVQTHEIAVLASCEDYSTASAPIW